MENGANGHDDGAQEDSLAASQGVTNEDGQDGTSKASQVVSSHSNALSRRIARRVGRFAVLGAIRSCVDRWEMLDEGRKVEETTCYTLIITKQSVPRDLATPHAISER